MDFARLLSETWKEFADEIVNLVLFTLLGVVLAFTIVLIPSVIGGWSRGILHYVRERKAPAFDELWCFDGYLDVLLFVVLGGLIISIGYTLLVIPGVILSVWWLYTIFYIADQDLGFVDAMRASKDAVSESGFMDHLVIFLVVGLLSGLGGSLSGAGTLFTTPFCLILLAKVYTRLQNQAVIVET